MAPLGEDDRQLILSVVQGDATAEELAALVAVVTARGAAAGEPAAVVPPSGWTARERGVRGVHSHGAGRWRASTLPR